MNNVEMGAVATAGIGGLTALWGQVNGILTRIRSLFVVSVDLYGNLGEHFLDYCWKNFTPVSLGDRAFIDQQSYIIPQKKYGYVLFERSGRFLTFLSGWKPLFVSNPTNSEGAMRGMEIKVSFIRGTFNADKFLESVVENHNSWVDQVNSDITKRNKRFFVQKVIGSSGDRDGDQASLKSSETASSNTTNGMRPIGWNQLELGSPSSESPFANLAYEKPIIDFKKEIIDWKNSKEWFESKGIPWRFGAGLYGPPGTGKSSFIRAAAQELDMPVHIYDLTTMSNKELVDFWQRSLLAAPCVVVFEDIDRIFDKDKNIRTSTKKDPLTLDCLLNCINGIQPAEGILVMVTANNIEKVDPALGVPDGHGGSTRPGRLDRAVYFGHLEEEGRIKIANRILSDCPELIDQTVKEGSGDSGAQFENRCAKIALAKKWGGFKVYS